MSKSRSQRRSQSARQERREAGEKRNVAWRALTDADQLRSLDARLGKGKGAKRQRAKLGQKMFTPVTAPTPPPVEVFASKSEEKRVKTLRAGKMKKTA
jgi:hypothetical protein